MGLGLDGHHRNRKTKRCSRNEPTSGFASVFLFQGGLAPSGLTVVRYSMQDKARKGKGRGDGQPTEPSEAGRAGGAEGGGGSGVGLSLP